MGSGTRHGQVTRRLAGSLVVEHVVHPALVQQVVRRRRVVVLVVGQRLQGLLDREGIGTSGFRTCRAIFPLLLIVGQLVLFDHF